MEDTKKKPKICFPGEEYTKQERQQWYESIGKKQRLKHLAYSIFIIIFFIGYAIWNIGSTKTIFDNCHDNFLKSYGMCFFLRNN